LSDTLSQKLGHTFQDQALLKRALTHASADAVTSNERLEFLGDRVLGLIVAEKLHALYPDDAEGALALKFNALARGAACARAAAGGGLGRPCDPGQFGKIGGRARQARHSVRRLRGGDRRAVSGRRHGGGEELCRTLLGPAVRRAGP
jgi:dsRNA-specific ribonuclease